MKKYSQMKNSGIKWIGDIPEDWDVKRLKFTTSFENSSIDRHTYDDEIEVSICHYPQVYQNEIITSKTIMENGTCTEQELNKFQLKKDDILITKDSETADEIGIPAYIQENCKNSVSGYHIAHLTTNKNKILGHFLFRYLQSDFVNGYFETEANGVTRFGLGKYSISNLKLILPSISEQKQIVFYLGKKTKKIDNEITKNQNLITLLQEKRQSEISHAVTKGLDDTVSMKDSGIEWIGDIPEHWNLKKVKFITKIIYGKSLPDEKRIIGDVPVYGSNGIIGNHNESISTSNTIIIGRKGSVGEINYSKEPCFPMDTAYYIDKNSTDHNLEWLFYALQSLGLTELNKDSVVPGLSREEVYNLKFPILEKEEKQIANYLNEKTKKIDSLISKVELQITNLQEFRESLISSAVTGKIKVTQA